MAPKAGEEQKATKSKAEKKPVVKKAEKKIKADTKGDSKKKKSKKNVETYKIYIYKVLKQVWRLLVRLLLGRGCAWLLKMYVC